MPIDLSAVFPGQSDAASLLRGLDWSVTVLGDPAGWPGGVRTAISLCMSATQPMVVVWRDTAFANDAWTAGKEPLDPREGLPPELREPTAARGVWSPITDDAGTEIGRVLVRDLDGQLAHKLRSPLGPLLMTLDLMKQRAPSHEVEIVERHVRQLATIVDDLTGVSGVRPRPAAPVTGIAPARILIVEDDDSTARALEAALIALGHVVALAHDGPVALVIARELQPDIVLVDIGLPVLDGWNLGQRMRELGIAPRIIAITARSATEDIQRSLAAGFEEHLVKPVDVERLAHVIADGAHERGVQEIR